MRVTPDLRIVIKAAERMQPAKSDSHNKRREQHKKAIEDFYKKYPRKAARIKRLQKQQEALNTKIKANEDLLDSFGINFKYEQIHDVQAFKEAGGTPPECESTHWSFEQVIAELAAVKPAGAAAVLAKYGINWEDPVNA